MNLIEQLDALMSSHCFDAIDIAGQNCKSQPGAISCYHYHGVRFLLHQLGARTTLPCQYEVFYTDLKAMFKDTPAQDSPLRVLVSGTADFVIPTLVSSALKDAGWPLEVVIVDRCQTPLQFCRVAAGQFGFDWQYQQSDIMDLSFKQSFDLIVTDRLHGHIPPNIRPRVFDKLAGLLSPAGLFITMASIRPEGKPSSGDTDALLSKLDKIEERCGEQDRYSMEELAQMVTNYANIRSSYPVRNQTELKKVFNSGRMKTRSIKPVNSGHGPVEGKDLLSLVKLVAQRRS